MILILLSIVAAAVISGALFLWGDDGHKTRHTLASIAGFFGLIASGISAIVYAFAGWGWIAAEHKADIINREYGTTYTRAEVFYASDVIETVRQLDRKRYEINGDLARETER